MAIYKFKGLYQSGMKGGGNRESSGGSSFSLTITAPQTTWLLLPPSTQDVFPEQFFCLG